MTGAPIFLSTDILDRLEARGGTRMRGLALFLLYYLVVTPVGLLCRVVHDPLNRAYQPQAASYLIYL
jgi:hypothetical protein